MSDPMSDIEDRKAMQDIGVNAYHIYQGARAEGASRLDAFILIAAWFKAALDQAGNLGEEA